MPLHPWHNAAASREELRKRKPLDASECAVHLDDARNHCAPLDCHKPAHVHPGLVPFAFVCGKALKDFLVKDVANTDNSHGRPVEALSMLCLSHADEKRGSGGVLVIKKGWGF